MDDLLSITKVSLSIIRLEPGARNDQRLAHKLLEVSPQRKISSVGLAQLEL